MKRILSIILMIFTIASLFVMPATSFADNDFIYSSFEKACDVMRYSVLQWKKDCNSPYDFDVTIRFYSDHYNKDTMFDEVEKEVFKYTGDYYKGDGLRANLYSLGINSDAEKIEQNGNPIYVVTVNIYGEYVLPRQKVQHMNKWIEDNAVWLATKKYNTGTSEYGKARGIYLWITKNVKYGREDVDNVINAHTTAYGAKYGQAVCHGFAHLYYMMANKCGLQCRMQVSFDHAWCVVRVDGKWYIVDPTIGRLRSEKDYFLVGTQNYSRYKSVRTDVYGGNVKVNNTRYRK